MFITRNNNTTYGGIIYRKSTPSLLLYHATQYVGEVVFLPTDQRPHARCPNAILEKTMAYEKHPAPVLCEIYTEKIIPKGREVVRS